MVQKRFMAKGRSAEMTSTTVLGSLPPVSLNLRVEVAQVGVSRLGTMFRIFFLPLYSASPTSFRSMPVSLKSGACAPFCGEVAVRVDGVALQRDGGHRWKSFRCGEEPVV